jgi:hypothetical protein
MMKFGGGERKAAEEEEVEGLRRWCDGLGMATGSIWVKLGCWEARGCYGQWAKWEGGCLGLCLAFSCNTESR